MRALSPARAGLLAILLLVVANAVLVQRLGANETSHYALVRALAHGHATIDEYQAETVDKTYFEGHFYANKAPGLAFLTLPLYEAATAAHAPIGDPRVALWAFGLVWAVGASGALLLLVRLLAQQLEPGYGALAAVALGLSTLLLPFSSLYFSHAVSALLGFAAFALLWRERRRAPRLWPVALAGLAGGAAVVIEFPIALVSAILLVYACSRAADRPRRAAVYLGSALLGVLPLLVYNAVVYGSVGHSTYDDTVLVPGRSGHDVVGQLPGISGLSTPDPRVLIALLVASKGVLVLTPVLAAAAAGLVALYRRGDHRAEAWVIGAVALVFLVYNSGFFAPFGGDGPGPRYLIPALPFLGLPLAVAFRRWPAATGALAALSAVAMLAATVSEPLLGTDDTGLWAHLLLHGDLTKTVVTYAGAGHGWPAMLPFVLLVAAAAALAVHSAPRPSWRRADVEAAAAALAGWLLLAAAGHRLLRTNGVFSLPHSTPGAVAAAAVLAAVVLGVCLLEGRTPTGRDAR